MPRLSKIGAAALAAFGWTSGSAVTATYLVVAGGGGGGTGVGGTANGGGGGAGGYQAGTTSLNPTLSYTVTVGAGGSASSNGSTSQLGVLTASVGGGGGGTNTGNGQAGGSGGAASSFTSSTAGAGTSGQGNAGGTQQINNATGGGGGASAVGGNGASAVGGNGGAGTASSISGASVTYAGGGGGAVNTGGTAGSGGAGGGGAGGLGSGAATAGTANTGGGGGGAASSVAGGQGGSGIVIISYVGAQQFGGGVVTSVGGNTIHTFTTSGTLVPVTPLSASYLVVAGGGGGGFGYGAGGGGGGLLSGSGVTIDPNSTYLVTVGAGGLGSPSSGQGSSGSNSSFSIVATSAVGGGGGGGLGATTGASGGSGGGGGGNASGAAGGSATSGQGFAGGSAFGGSPGAAGGGGGAGAVGGNGTSGVGGVGGAGASSSISGSSVTYAGGGGANADGTNSAGGAGGGGAGGNPATNGTANLGGGGGGSGTSAGNGGSGVVIIAYPGSTQQMAGGTVTISGGNVIHTFTSSGYLTPIKYASRSLRFRSSASAYLNRTPTVASNRTTWTWSAWVKRGAQGSQMSLFHAYDGSSSQRADFQFTSGNTLTFYKGGTGTPGQFTSLAVFRDPSAWYHIVLVADYSNATSGNRALLYVNGVAQSLTINTTFDTSNGQINGNWAHQIGGYAGGTYVDGYLTEINFIDGAALTPSSFGTFNSYGVWQPITYGGSYGTNGFYLTFGNNTSTTTLGYDTSPQGNNWTTNNISLTAGTTYDSMTDVPTLTSATVANYPTMNPLVPAPSGYGAMTFSNGNLNLVSPNASGVAGTAYALGTMSTTDGKYYFEVTISAGSAAAVGIAAATYVTTSGDGGTGTGSCIYYGANGNVYNNSGTSTAFGASYTTATIGVAFDVPNQRLWFAKDNVFQASGNPAAGTNFISYGITGAVTAIIADLGGTTTITAQANFGQRPFTYTPPSGFVALNTYNLSTPTIPNGAVYMAATTYTGTGAALTVANTVNGTNFQPDWVWIKGRNATYSHALFDVNRGVRNVLSSNSTNAEVLETAGTSMTAFNSGGFSLGTNGSTASTNVNGSTFVAWQWKANGAGVSNTNGSITSTVSANTTAGFSVVTYTGTGANATVGHGLGAVPSMIIVKRRNSTGSWDTYHVSIGNTKALFLNQTAAQNTDVGYWNNTTPTSSVFTVGIGTEVNQNTGTYVAYCFAAIAGFSAMGSYTGNGSTDGPFVYTGFRPRFVMVKCSSNATSSTVWTIWDTSRSPYNASVNELYPNLSAAEGVDSSGIDILSNGFKPKRNSEYANLSGWTYIYYAVAENPFKYSLAR